MRTKYSIDTQYEILVRLSLSLFAANPDKWTVTFKDLELLDDPQVSSYQCLYAYLTLSFYFSSRPHWQEPGIRLKTRLTNTVLSPLQFSQNFFQQI